MNWLLAGLALVGGLLLVVGWPWFRTRHLTWMGPAEQLRLANDLRRTAAQIVGGGFVALGAYLAYQNYLLAQDSNLAERFSQATARLDNSAVEVRLGSIYSLERIAQDSRHDHWVVIEVLNAYVRTHSPPTTTPKQDVTDPGLQLKPAVDLQSVLTVLGRSMEMESRDQHPLSLDRLDLRGAGLQGAKFSGVVFSGSDLRRADFRRADLRHANFADPRLTSVARGYTNGQFLNGANLRWADLREAHLSHAVLRGADISFAHLRRADVSDVRAGEMIANCADFEGANLANADLPISNLRSADFFSARLPEVRAPYADFGRAILIGADLKGGDFSDANFSGARLSGADLREAMLGGANFTGTDLRGADLSTAKGLRQEQVDGACLNSTTKLPTSVTAKTICEDFNDDLMSECGLKPLILGGPPPKVPEPAPR